ncbi:MAG: hypothetical protein QOG09_1330 [Solirubrobacterales bacterium]|jgi:uncharacterized membrane protein YgcG|nr:hypothetical protein [Solirubrobacterales bacterium]
MTAAATAKAPPPPPPTLQAARAKLPRAAATAAPARPAKPRRGQAPRRGSVTTVPARRRAAVARPRPAAKPRTTAKPRPAKASTRKAAASRPARSAAAKRRSQLTPPAGQLIPLAVGHAAVAVRGLPDSSFVVRMTRGRAWIGLLGTLLAGIVALNVISLGLSSSSSRVTQEATTLQQENLTLKARIAQQLSNDRVEAAAARLGLVVPPPGDIAYLTIGSSDAARAAARLGRGGLSGPTTLAGAPAATPAPAPTAPAPPAAAQPQPPPSTAQAQPPPSASPQPAQPQSAQQASTGGGASHSGGGSGSGGGVAAG